MKNFIFFENEYKKENNPDSRYVFINKKIKKKSDLIEKYNSELNCPYYFGFNWDALYDCLIDLNWITQSNIIVIHEDIPLEGNNEEQFKYITLLSDLAKYWIGRGTHELYIAFPSKCHHQVLSILSETEKDGIKDKEDGVRPRTNA